MIYIATCVYVICIFYLYRLIPKNFNQFFTLWFHSFTPVKLIRRYRLIVSSLIVRYAALHYITLSTHLLNYHIKFLLPNSMPWQLADGLCSSFYRIFNVDNFRQRKAVFRIFLPKVFTFLAQILCLNWKKSCYHAPSDKNVKDMAYIIVKHPTKLRRVQTCAPLPFRKSICFHSDIVWLSYLFNEWMHE